MSTMTSEYVRVHTVADLTADNLWHRVAIDSDSHGILYGILTGLDPHPTMDDYTLVRVLGHLPVLVRNTVSATMLD